MRFARIRKALLVSEHASLDVDLRYLPAIRFLKRYIPDGRILEVGSGPLGLAAYVRRAIVTTDVSYDTGHLPNMIPVVAKGPLPFRDASFRAAISLDAFEHVPREHRQLFLEELLRVTDSYVIVGFPEGADAERHDSAMEAYYLGQWGRDGTVHHFFVEHREYEIPRSHEMGEYFARVRDARGWDFSVQRFSNVNIALRSLFCRLAWHRKSQVRAIYVMLTLLGHLDRLLTFGRCYRAIYIIKKRVPLGFP